MGERIKSEIKKKENLNNINFLVIFHIVIKIYFESFMIFLELNEKKI